MRCAVETSRLHSQQWIAADGGMHCIYAGAGERAGAYIVEATADSSSKTITDIVVTKDACHVRPQAVTIEL